MIRGALILATGIAIGYAKAQQEHNALTDMVADMKRTANELGAVIKAAPETPTQTTEGETQS